MDNLCRLLLFHIPLPEYNEAARSENAILRGTRMEEACAPKLNTGMFAAMKEAGDVMGMFVGHDHDNDYAVMWKDILWLTDALPVEIRNITICRMEPVLLYWMRVPVHSHPGFVRKTVWWIKSLIRQVLSRTIGLNVETCELHVAKARVF